MNDCRHIRKQFITLIEDRLPSDVRELSMQHINSCSACNLLFHNLQQTYQVSDKRPDIDPGPFFYTRVEQRLKNQHHVVGVQINRIIQPLVICLLTGAGIFTGILIGRNLSESTITITTSTNNEALGSYASDFYLTGTGEESLETLINNE